MGDLGNIYKIFFRLEQFVDEETKEDGTRETFNAIELKVRNKNKFSYRYYDEDGETKTINNGHLNGVFIDNLLMSTEPSVTAYVISTDKDMFEVVTGKVPAKDEEEEKGLADFKESLKKIAEDTLARYIEKIQRLMSSMVPQPTVTVSEEANGTTEVTMTPEEVGEMIISRIETDPEPETIEEVIEDFVEGK